MYKNKIGVSWHCFVDVTQYYVNDDLVYRGHIHNMYIRIKVVKVDGMGYYKVVIGGYGMDTIDVTHLSKQPDKLFHLGRTIALNIGCNFFDYDDMSARHTIKHRCTHRSTVAVSQ